MLEHETITTLCMSTLTLAMLFQMVVCAGGLVPDVSCPAETESK